MAEPERVEVIPAGETREQLWLKDAPAGTHFDARGLTLFGGASNRFVPPPRFCLFSDPDRAPGEGVGYESTERLQAWELPNEERYPIQLRDMESPSISGFTVIGVQPGELPWRVMKEMWDGDALHVKHCRGRVAVSSVFWENVEDGFGPNEGVEYWSLRDAYLKYIRDDAIENDDLISGEVVNCLVDGCFTFLSQRSEPARASESVTTIRDCVIHVQAQPHDGIPGKEWRDRNIHFGADGIGRAPGMLFKWAPDAGTVEMKNCVVRIDAVSVNGVGDAEFPPGIYENVEIVWLGDGPYPGRLPDGVTVTRDPEVWAAARKGWIERMDPAHPAASLLRGEKRRDASAELGRGISCLRP